jgi:putative colanic acid biosynthesis acetyltransferase WcaF
VHVYPNVRIWAPWLLRIDDFAGVADGVTLYDMAEIHLGRFAVVSQGAHLCAGSHDIDSPTFQLIAKPISIGDRAWICAQAFVGPGVDVAQGCVLGACAVAMKSINAEWTVWAGNPARMIRARARRDA